MIQAVVLFELWCDLCPNDLQVHSDEPHWTAEGMAAEIEGKLARSGWWRSKGGAVHVCPSCQHSEQDKAARAMASDGGRVEMPEY